MGPVLGSFWMAGALLSSGFHPVPGPWGIALNPYLSAHFPTLQELQVRLSQETSGFIELEYDELLFAGFGRFPKRIPRAGHVMEELMLALEARRNREARKLLNFFGPICGMKLLGLRWLDHLWWWLDRKVTGLSTDKELCRWWAIGVLEPKAENASPSPDPM